MCIRDRDVDVIYKRKPKAPVQEVTFADGSKGEVWCTFSDEQIDLDVRTDVTRRFIADTIASMCQNGAGLIRLDAFAYAVKKPGTSCFFVEPEIWELLGWIGSLAAPLGAALLQMCIRDSYYTPQIWCSDNTDAIDRLTIQYGTSFGYPISAVGAHVSAVPNHQTCLLYTSRCV